MPRTRCAAPRRGPEDLDPLEEGVAPKVRGAPTPRRGGGGGPLSPRPGRTRTWSLLPARDVETGGRASSASCQRRGLCVMPLQVMEMRLFVKGQVLRRWSRPCPLSRPLPHPERQPQSPAGRFKAWISPACVSFSLYVSCSPSRSLSLSIPDLLSLRPSPALALFLSQRSLSHAPHEAVPASRQSQGCPRFTL